jgi:hypothetical protein
MMLATLVLESTHPTHKADTHALVIPLEGQEYETLQRILWFECRYIEAAIRDLGFRHALNPNQPLDLHLVMLYPPHVSRNDYKRWASILEVYGSILTKLGKAISLGDEVILALPEFYRLVWVVRKRAMARNSTVESLSQKLYGFLQVIPIVPYDYVILRLLSDVGLPNLFQHNGL